VTPRATEPAAERVQAPVRSSPFPVVLVVVLGLAGAAAGQPAPGNAAEPVVVERLSAVVNDAIILESEVVQRATPMLMEIESLDAQERAREWRQILRKTVEQMVDEELIVQAAAEAKLEVSGDEVKKAIDEIKRQNRLTDAQLEQALVQQGTTMASYRGDIRRQILRLRAVSTLVRPRVQVSEEQIKTRYERMAGQSAVVTEVHLRHILIALPERSSTAQLEAARRRAGELVARARAGEDFEALAKEASQDPTTSSSGGDLGWYKRGELPTEWEEIVFAMDPGETRGPVQGPRGLHVFQLAEHKRETVRPLEEIKDSLREQIFGEEMEKQTRVWLQELRKKAHLEVKL
jgi:peptidyl-prolyl cis-trans isomerase SurA